MTTSRLLPSLRGIVGDWSYYVTTLTFRDVTALIKSTDEIHERIRLADWIQRVAIDAHAKDIAAYITETPQRFLGSLVVGVYGGAPNWTSLNVRVPEDEGITPEQVENLEGRIGLLHFSGEEKLFAIDGQLRVAGIKQAVKQADGSDCPLLDETVSAIFVAHDPKTEEGKRRTRRLFTTVNKKAKIVSKAARIALDEDDGYAIVTRRMIDEHWLFSDDKKYVLYSTGGSLPALDTTSITSVVGLYEIIKDITLVDIAFGKKRPMDADIADALAQAKSYFDTLLESIPEYSSTFLKEKHKPGYYRSPTRNHLLFRPIGQRTFARATRLLVSRGKSTSAAVEALSKAPLYLQNDVWHHIMWDPVSSTMITNKIVIAEAQLLRLAGQPVRNKSSAAKLDHLLKSV